jgi:glutaredoxin
MRLPSTTIFLASLLAAYHVAHFVSAFSAQSSAYRTLQNFKSLKDPLTGKPSTIPLDNAKRSLVVLLPQLGEFDSSEYCEFLIAAEPALEKNNVDLHVVGIGDSTAAQTFCAFTGLSPRILRTDPEGILYKELGLYNGPDLSIPEGVSDDVLKFFLRQLPGGVPKEENELRPAALAWLKYNAMCVGIGAPGTLREILRGYFGDKKAPERFRDDDVVRAGFVEIGPGVGPTRIGPLKYNQWFSDERGYQRPVELATVRLKNLVEVLSKWDDYVSNLDTIPQRGATYLFDADGSELYSYQSRGVLTYSETMPRPLTFLAPYIGEEVALNPLGLKDNGGGELKRGRGILKPAGKAMGFLSFLFKLENKLQAKVLGVEESDFVAARKEIDDTIKSHKIVVYTYGLSPFSNEALAVLDEIGANYTNIELGLEWFLLDKEKSTIRAELLEMTGQSSLPHVFIDGNHIGGVFTGTPDGSSPGLAGLKESGELKTMIA